jgi:hypothetical protein
MTGSGREVPIDPAPAAADYRCAELLHASRRRLAAEPRCVGFPCCEPAGQGIAERQRGAGAEIEVLYSVIENMAQNGRDHSLDYRIVATASWDTRVVDAIAPPACEMVFCKISSKDFDSTNTGVTA